MVQDCSDISILKEGELFYRGIRNSWDVRCVNEKSTFAILRFILNVCQQTDVVGFC